MFEMPTPEELAKMSAEEVENKKIEAEKEANEMARFMSNIQLERNELKRQDTFLADKITKARCNIRDYKLAASELNSLFFRKRSGY